MSDVADLWNRIEEARKRLGAAEETQIKQIADLNEQVKGVRNGLARRYRELEEHREAMSKIRQENEQLRRMLHRVLLGIEQRYDGRLVELVKNLEGEVSALLPMTSATKANGPAPQPKATDQPKAETTAKPKPPAFLGGQARVNRTGKGIHQVLGQAKASATPSESDSRWLHQIMERARELTETDPKTGPARAERPSNRGAAA
jgi:predicted nuclease with TOPRIM domain